MKIDGLQLMDKNDARIVKNTGFMYLRMIVMMLVTFVRLFRINMIESLKSVD